MTLTFNPFKWFVRPQKSLTTDVFMSVKDINAILEAHKNEALFASSRFGTDNQHQFVVVYPKNVVERLVGKNQFLMPDWVTALELCYQNGKFFRYSWVGKQLHEI